MGINMRKVVTGLCIMLALFCTACGKKHSDIIEKTAERTAEASEAAEPPRGNEVVQEAAGEIVKERSIAELLRIAREPLGKTMYVWGGGWNEEDTGAGEEARSLGVSPRWEEFAAIQQPEYDYRSTRYQIHDGLDCSGYIGWLIYNVLETKAGEEGYVTKATDMAEDFARRGFGEFTEAAKVSDWQAGDIMSMKGHVWMALGMCEDGSVVLLHASPPGVMLSGTRLEDGSVSEAVLLAKEYMSTYYPEWYERYPEVSRGVEYLTASAQMRWSTEVLSDEQGLRGQSVEAVLQWMFAEEDANSSVMP